MSKARRLAITLMSVLFALTFMLGLVACGGGQSAKDAINAYLLPQDNTLVDNDFTLPKKIGINDGVKVKWKSDNAAITIEEGTADAYDAKVTLQDTVTSVTLTISSGKASKDFTVRVDELNVFTFMKRYGNDDYDSESFPQRKTAQKEDFALDSSYTVQGKTAKITWASKDTEYLEVITNADGTQTAHPKPGDDLVKVKLTATFAYGEGDPTPTASKDYEISVSPDLDHRQLVNKLYSEAGFPIEFEGYVVHVYEAKNSEQYGPMASFYAVDSDFCSGYYIWQAALESAEDVAKVKPGAHFTFSGDIAKNYNGLWESNGYEDGTAVFDDKPAIDINEHIRAFDNEAIAATDSARWQMSRLVSLSGWKVSGELETDAKGNVSFALTYGDRILYVYTSTYVTTDDDAMTALKAKFATLHDGTFINITGILGYNNSKGEFNPKSFRIQPRTADDITVVQAQGTNDGAKLKAAYAAVQAAVEKNFSGLITTAKENVQMPTANIANAEGVTVSYRLAKKVVEGAPVVVGTDGKISVTPQATDKTCLIEVNYTIGGKVVAQSVFTIRSWQATDQDIVDEVASALNNSRIDTITSAGEYDLPKVETFGATVTWKLGKEDAPAPEWAHIEGTKLVIDYLPMQDTALKLYAKVTLDSTTSDEIFFNVKVTAMPNKTFSALTAPKSGTYQLAMYSGNKKATYYATGAMDGYYFATTLDISQAADFVIKQNGEANQYTIQINGKYLEFAPAANGKANTVDINMNDKQTEGKYWRWIEGIRNFVFESRYNKGGDTEDETTDLYYFGNFSSNTSMSGNYIGRIATKGDGTDVYTPKADTEGVSQWVAHFGTLVEATDETRANEVLNSLTLTQTSFSETTGDEGIALPTSKQYNATVVWSVKDQTSLVSIEDNVLTISSLPTADTEVTLKVTVTVNEKIVSKDVTITIKPTYTFVGAGTKENPYTVADALALGTTITKSGDFYTKEGSAAEIYVKGYITDKGGTYGTDYMSTVLIADVKDGTPTLKLYTIKWNTVVSKAADGSTPLRAGDYVVIRGWLKLYGTELEIDKLDNNNVPEFTTWTPAERTDEDKANDVLASINLAKTLYNEPESNIVLPEGTASENEATVAWKVKTENVGTYVTVTDNKLNILSIPDTTTRVTLTVTVTLGDTATASKDVVITLEKPITQEPGTVLLTPESVWGDKTGSGYSAFNGTYPVEGYQVTTAAVMKTEGIYNGSSTDPFGFTALQFQKTNGKLTITGNFTKIVMVIVTDTAYDSLGDKMFTVKAGETALVVASHTTQEGVATVAGKSYYAHTVEYTVTGGEQEISIAAGTGGAGYLKYIILTEKALTPEEMQSALQTELEKVAAEIEVPTQADVTLPASTDKDISFTWKVKAEGTQLPGGITLQDGVIKVTELPASATDVTLILTATYKDSEPEQTKTKEVTLKISAKPVSDEAKAQEVLGSITLSKTVYDAVDTEGTTLPAPDTYGAQVEWKVEPASDYAEVSGGKLIISSLPTERDETVTLKVTVTVGNDSVDKTIEITVKKAINYGTEEAPISVAEALTIAEAECPGSNEWTKQKIYVTGKVKGAPTGSAGAYIFTLVDLTDAQKEIEIYKMDEQELPVPMVNDTVVIYGWIENYFGNTLQFTGYASASKEFPVLVKCTGAEATITLGAHDGADVTGFDDGDTKTAKNHETFTFTVTAQAEKRVDAVKVNNSTIQAKEGTTYEFTVAGDATVTVETSDASAPEKQRGSVTTVIADYATKTGNYVSREGDAWQVGSGTSDPKYDTVKMDEVITAKMTTGDYTGLYNSSKQWQLYQSGGGSLTISAATGYKITSITIKFATKNNGIIYPGTSEADKLTSEVGKVFDTNSVTFNVKTTTSGKSNGQVKIESITVEYESTGA